MAAPRTPEEWKVFLKTLADDMGAIEEASEDEVVVQAQALGAFKLEMDRFCSSLVLKEINDLQEVIRHKSSLLKDAALKSVIARFIKFAGLASECSKSLPSDATFSLREKIKDMKEQEVVQKRRRANLEALLATIENQRDGVVTAAAGTSGSDPVVPINEDLEQSAMVVDSGGEEQQRSRSKFQTDRRTFDETACLKSYEHYPCAESDDSDYNN